MPLAHKIFYVEAHSYWVTNSHLEDDKDSISKEDKKDIQL
jgi:hypothetical protein